jgi:hypothetical protein
LMSITFSTAEMRGSEFFPLYSQQHLVNWYIMA